MVSSRGAAAAAGAIAASERQRRDGTAAVEGALALRGAGAAAWADLHALPQLSHEAA